MVENHGAIKSCSRIFLHDIGNIVIAVCVKIPPLRKEVLLVPNPCRKLLQPTQRIYIQLVRHTIAHCANARNSDTLENSIENFSEFLLKI